MSDAASNLLAALLGAIVGGLLALAGSVLVNMWEVRRRARFRIYEELLPRVMNETWPLFRWGGQRPGQFEQSMDALQRASAVLGPNEWTLAFIAQLNAGIYIDQFVSKPESDDEKQERAQALEDIAKQIDDDLERLDGFWNCRSGECGDPRGSGVLGGGGSGSYVAARSPCSISPPKAVRPRETVNRPWACPILNLSPSERP